jgi:glycosyltransferase involved in cell wall biosynthesis
MAQFAFVFRGVKSIRILHYVFTDWPDQVGYVIRTNNLINEQIRLGLNIAIARSVDHNINSGIARKQSIKTLSIRDGIPHYTNPKSPWYLPSKLQRPFLKREHVSRAYRNYLADRYSDWIFTQQKKPDIIHAHSPARVIEDANHMGKMHQLPIVAEVRGFWEMSRMLELGKKIDIRKTVAADVEAAKKATKVVAISKGIADILVQYGVPSANITIVPNGVNAAKFKTTVSKGLAKKTLGWGEHFIFGYITNVRRMEGIETIVRAWPTIKRKVPNALFLLIGIGEHLSEIRHLVDQSSIADSFKIVGAIPHSEIVQYYRALDVFVVPRIDSPLTQAVTPLKPLEAMASETPVIASDIAALREMIEDEQTGILFAAENAEMLAEKCIHLAQNKELRNRIAKQALEFINRERNWPSLGQNYHKLYQQVLG